MRFTFASEQWLPYPIEIVFAFFADPANLPRLLPAWQKAGIENVVIAATPPHPNAADSLPGVAAGAGTRLTLTFQPVPLVPFRLAWDAEISEFVWNDHFCDIQLKRGPFAFWRHCHTLRPEARERMPGTLLHDEIDYTPPLGVLGALAKPFIAFQLNCMFAYRHAETVKLLPPFAASLR